MAALPNFSLKKTGLFVFFVGSTLQYGDYTVDRYFIPLLSTILALFLYLNLRKNQFKINKKLNPLPYEVLISYLFVVFILLLGKSPATEAIFDLVKIGFCFLVFVLAVFFGATIRIGFVEDIFKVGR
jgi:RsiW-degrading membrane proteinase PrsW (M82 family)